MLSSLSKKSASFDGAQWAKTLGLYKKHDTKTSRPANRYKWAGTWTHNHPEPLAGPDLSHTAVLASTRPNTASL